LDLFHFIAGMGGFQHHKRNSGALKPAKPAQNRPNA